MNKIIGGIVGKTCNIDIIIDPPKEEKKRKRTNITINDPHDQFGNEGKSQVLTLLDNEDPVQGKIVIKPLNGSFDHNGIKIELIGETSKFLFLLQSFVFGIKTNKPIYLLEQRTHEFRYNSN
jgi:hypothetical protein